MMTADQRAEPGDDRHGVWAVIDHIRTDQRFDAPVRLRIEADGGLTGYTAAAIAIEYGLLRSLSWTAGFAQYDGIAEAVNEMARNAPASASISETCDHVTQLAKKLRASVGSGKRTPYSAASKFYWFARPADWTMFDSHAFRAFYTSSKGRSEDFITFYASLEQSGFVGMARQLSTKARSLGLQAQGARVLDKMLMLRGSARQDHAKRFGENVRSACRAELAKMDAATRAAVFELGELAHKWKIVPVSRQKRQS